MSYKKHGWDECDNINNKWENICYYQCKYNGCENCKEDIYTTRDIIDTIKEKNSKLGNDLKHAKDNQSKVKLDLVGVDDNVGKLAINLGDIEEALEKATHDLEYTIDELNKAVNRQKEALNTINDGQYKQQDIKGLAKDLDCSFDKTVNCLKKKDKPPVLIPWEDCDETISDSDCE